MPSKSLVYTDASTDKVPSSLLPINDVVSGTGIIVTKSNGAATISSDISNSLVLSSQSLTSSVNSQISTVTLPIIDVVAGTNTTVSKSGGIATINATTPSTTNTLALSGQTLTSTVNGQGAVATLPIIDVVGGSGITVSKSGGSATISADAKKTFTVTAMSDQSIDITSPASAIFNQQTVNTGERVFLPFQSDPSQNGIYTFNGVGVAMTRPSDYNASSAILESVIVVRNGVWNVAGSTWINTNTSTIVVGTDPITYKSGNRGGRLYIAKAIAIVTNVTISNPGSSSFPNAVSLTAGDIVLLAVQTASSENGLYIFTSSSTPLIRLPNYQTSEEITSSTIYVRDGSRGAAFYRNTNTSSITLGTTALTFEWFAGNRPSTTISSTTTLGSVNLTNYISSASGNVTATLASASAFTGKQVIVKRTDTTSANTCTISGHIDGTSGATRSLVEIGATSGYNSLILESNGTTWYVVGGLRYPLT